MTNGAAFDALPEDDKRFVLAYLRLNCNGTRAYMEVHSEASYGTARVMASRKIANPSIRRALDEIRLAEMGNANESLLRMQQWARATIEDVIDDHGKLDLKKARANGAVHAIKAITSRTYFDKGLGVEVTETRVELHDAKDAEKVLMKYRGLLSDLFKFKDLPEDPAELSNLFITEMERVTGRKVMRTAGTPKESN